MASDVSDEAIIEALCRSLTHPLDGSQHRNVDSQVRWQASRVRALLDAQAAAHAAEVGQAFRDGVARGNEYREAAERRADTLAAEVEALRADHELLTAQIDRLASFIMDSIPGEPSRSEGAVDCAIRLLADRDRAVRDALEAAAVDLLYAAGPMGSTDAARIVRSRIPEGDTE